MISFYSNGLKKVYREYTEYREYKGYPIYLIQYNN
jgi:hypothetical protein